MSKMAEANVSSSLKEILSLLKSLASDMSDIKTKLQVKNNSGLKYHSNHLAEGPDSNGRYPWNLENTTTTADYYDEEL
tara:strand:- start:1322 stop:1555 length:234 start_codon:yes stop_codon:yes gene_type:complete